MSDGSTGASLTHLDAEGRASMVDVGAKPESERMARARGRIRMHASTLELIRARGIEKGDVFAVARIAGIQAAKRTAELIPLCHAIPLTQVELRIEPDLTLPGLEVIATARTRARTGVEMEALTAVSVALLSIYDMAKAVDRGMTLGTIELLEKQGGVQGHWRREASD
ncbi:MAG: cyclic pyranopterin monophosphate synthase MoaC [Caldilineae bacterium]|nr:cyclic pyranopterin monophosphate synthase MoaC [Chloroflexota bacterium]MCB9175618.1 cyclic pyranopterin monophosphate synthase MoaC [Caldilineae bacterium]